MSAEGMVCPACGWLNTWQAIADNGGVMYCCRTAERRGELR